MNEQDKDFLNQLDKMPFRTWVVIILAAVAAMIIFYSVQ